ncbi:hypothetical protein [Sphaerisporangium aureirubrum]|uniref:Uncharacterized protein n=1 Tax=Sphaerisporangium aureirubrum TaxID=1544736 RepID=A0ABW1NDM6_9ACTN
MQPFSAGMVVLAAVLETLSLDLPEHADDALVQVEVLPPQPERFALPEPQRERDRPTRAVSTIYGLLQHGARLSGRQRLYLDVLARGSVDQRADAFSCPTPPDP